MVSRFVALLGRSSGGIHEAALVLGLSAIVSQLLALIRDRLLAARFGAEISLDIYYAAFKIPDILYVSIASLVSVTILLPFIVKRLDNGVLTDRARGFVNTIFTFFSLLMIIFAGISFIIMPFLSRFVVPGF